MRCVWTTKTWWKVTFLNEYLNSLAGSLHKNKRFWIKFIVHISSSFYLPNTPKGWKFISQKFINQIYFFLCDKIISIEYRTFNFIIGFVCLLFRNDCISARIYNQQTRTHAHTRTHSSVSSTKLSSSSSWFTAIQFAMLEIYENWKKKQQRHRVMNKRQMNVINVYSLSKQLHANGCVCQCSLEIETKNQMKCFFFM